MEELIKKREDIKKQIDDLSIKMSILKEQKEAVEAEILPQLKTPDGAKLTMRYEDKTVSIGTRKGIKILDEKLAVKIIPENERDVYYRLDRVLFAQAVKGYIQNKKEVPAGIEQVESEYLLVKEVKKTIKETK